MPSSESDRRVYRRSATARRVRDMFPVGSRVAGWGGTPPRASNVHGTIMRHLPAYNGQGGSFVVAWDNGYTGHASPIALIRVED